MRKTLSSYFFTVIITSPTLPAKSCNLILLISSLFTSPSFWDALSLYGEHYLLIYILGEHLLCDKHYSCVGDMTMSKTEISSVPKVLLIIPRSLYTCCPSFSISLKTLKIIQSNNYNYMLYF